MENFLSNLLGSFGIFPSKEKLEKREAYQNDAASSARQPHVPGQ